jgi:hypothetical protein
MLHARKHRQQLRAQRAQLYVGLTQQHWHLAG